MIAIMSAKRLVVLLTITKLAVVVFARRSIIVSASIELPETETLLPDVGKLFPGIKTIDGEQLDLLDYLIQDLIPPLFGQRPNNENGSRIEFKDLALSDDSNDDAAHLSTVSSCQLSLDE